MAKNPQEKGRADKALADATSEHGRAEASTVRAVQMDCLFSAMDMEVKGKYATAEQLYLHGREVMKIFPGGGYGRRRKRSRSPCGILRPEKYAGKR